MQFIEFRKLLGNFVCFSKIDIEKLFPAFNKMNLVNWQKKGYIIKIKNGWYSFTDFELYENKLYSIANKIYDPSYISMETALFYYGFIPEAVFKISSVSTLKTNAIKTKIGDFVYHSIKEKLFFGYSIVKEEKAFYKIAYPEKAILDFLYFKKDIKTIDDFSGLRLNKKRLSDTINLKKIDNSVLLFESKALTKRAKLLKEYLYA